MEQLSVLSELKRFSIAEKIIIVEELWNRIAADQESFGLTGERGTNWTDALQTIMHPLMTVAHGKM